MPYLYRAAFAVLLGALVLGSAGCGTLGSRRNDPVPLAEALTLHAPFDRTTDAEFALGDAWLYTAPGMNKWKEALPGLPEDGQIVLAPGQGRHGGAIRFERNAPAVVYFQGGPNVAWRERNWSGTVSFWLRADFAELAEGFCDPIQITPRAWNDAAFFVEFERRGEVVPFRFGAYADYKVWNPLDRKWEEIPPAERPVVAVPGPPFSRDRWTHVAFTWAGFNTDRSDSMAVLYLDGAQVGSLAGRTQTFTWDPANTRILLGVGLVGWIDDLAVFNRALTGPEIQVIRRLPKGVASLRHP